MGQSASRAFGSRPAQSASSELDEEISRVRQFGDIATQRANALSAGELQANINRVKQYEPLANNEANRALGMNLATQFPYKKYESESTSAREIMNNAQSAIPTFLNRATAARLSPVSMSL